MERELTRRCRHIVRVAEFVALSAIRTIHTGDNATTNLEHKIPLFAGYVEVLYARTAWLAVRTDIWTSKGACYRQVKSLSVYLQQNDDDSKVVVASGDQLTALQNVEVLALSVEYQEEVPALTGNELTHVLETVVMQLLHAFREQQKLALDAQRATFEFEIRQHYSSLELLVLSSKARGNFVLFALSFLEENAHWDLKNLIETEEDVGTVYIPNGFRSPCFSDATDNVTLLIGYSLEGRLTAGSAWPLLVEWPAKMILSSQVTQIRPSSTAQSSLELITSCKKMFLHQWRRRKDFIAVLRRYVIVFEYDAVDFSQAFFMLQEQLNEQAPLRILILRLQFTAAFFHTNCIGDLHVSLLDGEAGAEHVTIALVASSDPPDVNPAIECKACVVQLLDAVQRSLLRYFYNE